MKWNPIVDSTLCHLSIADILQASSFHKLARCMHMPACNLYIRQGGPLCNILKQETILLQVKKSFL